MAAAAAAAAMGSLFSTSVQTLKCLHSKGIASTWILFQIGLASHIHAIDAFSIRPIFQKWQIPRIFVATTQEEAGAPTAEGVEKVSDGGEADRVVTGSIVNTIYFGNLPYHCDNAQLVGLIQQYASPELVEAIHGSCSTLKHHLLEILVTSQKSIIIVVWLMHWQ
ncbi:hypothetical protein NMG60_11024081 [Bertholletia excelsa]